MWVIEDISNEYGDKRLEPTLLNLTLHEQEFNSQDKLVRSKYGLALGVSALLHCIVFALLLSARIDPPAPLQDKNETVRLRLVPTLIPERQSISVPDIATAPAPSEDPVAAEPFPVTEVETSRQNLVEVPTNIPSIDFSAPLPRQADEGPQALTTLQLRSIVESNRYAQESHPEGIVCTPQQERSEFFDCPDNTVTRGYDAPTNPTADFFNRDSRAAALREQRLTTMRQIAGRLSDTGLDDSEIESLLQAIDIDKQDLNTSGNARTRNLRDQILMNDATEQLKKRVLNP